MKNRNKRLKNFLTKEFLIKEYTMNKKSTAWIAKKVGCNQTTVLRYLIRNNIPRRTNSAALRLLDKKGDKSHAYIDNRTNKIYYCKEKGCNNEISYENNRNGLGSCASCARKLLWQDPKYREKSIKAMFLGRAIFPNKPETLLIKLLNKLLPNEYTFVGDGKLIVSGFVPDFVNKDNNKIIEFYGDYWHNKKIAKKRDIGRLHAYKRNGYKTLIIWEYELQDLEKVKKNILGFNKLQKRKRLL